MPCQAWHAALCVPGSSRRRMQHAWGRAPNRAGAGLASAPVPGPALRRGQVWPSVQGAGEATRATLAGAALLGCSRLCMRQVGRGQQQRARAWPERGCRTVLPPRGWRHHRPSSRGSEDCVQELTRPPLWVAKAGRQTRPALLTGSTDEGGPPQHASCSRGSHRSACVLQRGRHLPQCWQAVPLVKEAAGGLQEAAAQARLHHVSRLVSPERARHCWTAPRCCPVPASMPEPACQVASRKSSRT